MTDLAASQDPPEKRPGALALPPDLPYILEEHNAITISTSDLEACFRLIKSTSFAAYRASSKGWSSQAKLMEMRDPDMRFLLVRRVGVAEEGGHDDGIDLVKASERNKSSGETRASRNGKMEQNAFGVNETASQDDEWEEEVAEEGILGFVSYMHTKEETVPVIYIYEIHLVESLRNQGVGRRLMEIVEMLGVTNGDEKTMLTVFLSNACGIRFYERLGYSRWDEEYVPVKKRRLRSGVKETRPSYIIMAKDLERKS